MGTGPINPTFTSGSGCNQGHDGKLLCSGNSAGCICGTLDPYKHLNGGNAFTCPTGYKCGPCLAGDCYGGGNCVPDNYVSGHQPKSSTTGKCMCLSDVANACPSGFSCAGAQALSGDHAGKTGGECKDSGNAGSPSGPARTIGASKVCANSDDTAPTCTQPSGTATAAEQADARQNCVLAEDYPSILSKERARQPLHQTNNEVAHLKFIHLYQQCDLALLYGGVGVEECARPSYADPTSHQWKNKRLTPAKYEHGEILGVSCWEERYSGASAGGGSQSPRKVFFVNYFS